MLGVYLSPELAVLVRSTTRIAVTPKCREVPIGTPKVSFGILLNMLMSPKYCYTAVQSSDHATSGIERS